MNNADTHMDIHSHNAIRFWLLSERLSELYSRSDTIPCRYTHIPLSCRYVYFLAFERISVLSYILYVYLSISYLSIAMYVGIIIRCHVNYCMLAKITSHNIGNVASNFAMRQNLRVNRALISRCAVKLTIYILWIINLCVRIALPAENVTLRRKCGTWVFVPVMKSVFTLRDGRDYLLDSF